MVIQWVFRPIRIRLTSIKFVIESSYGNCPDNIRQLTIQFIHGRDRICIRHHKFTTDRYNFLQKWQTVAAWYICMWNIYERKWCAKIVIHKFTYNLVGRHEWHERQVWHFPGAHQCIIKMYKIQTVRIHTPQMTAHYYCSRYLCLYIEHASGIVCQ